MTLESWIELGWLCWRLFNVFPDPDPMPSPQPSPEVW